MLLLFCCVPRISEMLLMGITGVDKVFDVWELLSASFILNRNSWRTLSTDDNRTRIDDAVKLKAGVKLAQLGPDLESYGSFCRVKSVEALLTSLTI